MKGIHSFHWHVQNATCGGNSDKFRNNANMPYLHFYHTNLSGQSAYYPEDMTMV